MVLYFIGIPLHNETHIWNISITNFYSYIKPALAVDLLLSPSAGLPKIAILVFYLRINTSRNFHICVWTAIGLTWAFIVATFCAILFSCRPIHKLWDPTAQGTCILELPILLVVPIISTILDLVILALPVPMLITLRENLRTKLVVAALFSAFSCTTVISAVRIWQLASLFGDTDITWDAALTGNLNIVENNMMIVCSCVLVLRPFCRRYFPSLLGRDSKPAALEAPDPDGNTIGGGPLDYNRPRGAQSKSDYHTNVRGGKNKKGKGRSRNLWSISFGHSTKADEDLESLEGESKRLPPSAADIGGGESAKNLSEKDEISIRQGESEKSEKSGDGPPKIGQASTTDNHRQDSANASEYHGEEGEFDHVDKESDGTARNGIVNTLSPDVQAHRKS